MCVLEREKEKERLAGYVLSTLGVSLIISLTVCVIVNSSGCMTMPPRAIKYGSLFLFALVCQIEANLTLKIEYGTKGGKLI